MSKTLRKLALTVILALALVVTGFSLALPGSQDAYAEPVWSDAEIADVYASGTPFTVPSREVQIDASTTVNATAVIVLPDGSVTTQPSLTLKMPGEYTVRYTAVSGTKSYVDEEKFIVRYNLVNYNDAESSYSYGVNEHAPNEQGLKVSIVGGDVMTFSPVVDLNNLTLNDVLVEFFVAPTSPGTLEFDQLFFKFEDIEDPDSYFRVRAMRSSDGVNYPTSYFLAAASGQPLSGWEGGTWNKLHVNNQWGTQAWGHSFYGVSSGENGQVNIGKTKITIRYDAASKAIYVNDGIIVDFDNPRYFTDLWDGFKSGRVRISMWAESYMLSHANFVITKLHGVDLASDIMEETTPPVLKIESDCDLDDMPMAEVGKKYTVPTATAFDEYSGNCAVKTSVIYNATDSANSVVVDVVDGAFEVDRPGVYAINYETEDQMANKATQTLWIRAVSDLADPSFVFDNPQTTALAGDWIVPAEYAIENGSGESDVTISYVFDGKETVITDGFRPDAAGTYTVKYTAVDYIGQTGEGSYDIVVTVGDKPVFVDSIVLPKYFVSGASYVLPDLYANDYTSGTLVRKLATVTVKDANGTTTVESGKAYIPATVENLEKAIVTYTVDGVDSVYEVPVVLAWKEESGRPRLQLQNYFDKNGVTMEKSDEYSTITATDAYGQWTFANALIAENFTTTISAVTSRANFDGLAVLFTDSENDKIAITAYIQKTNKTAQFITDAAVLGIESGFIAGASSNRFQIGYANKMFTIGGANVAVNNTVYGEKFEGFPSGKIYMTIAFVNATEGAQYNIVEINTQIISSTPYDRVAPKIVVLGTRGGIRKLNEVITLPAAIAGDTLDSNVTFTVTVTAPDKKTIVKDVNGVELKNVDPGKEYQIKVDEYGQYLVTYTAADTFNATPNKTNFTYAITIEDDVKPVITFKHGFATTAKVGDVIVIPDFTVTDNVSATNKIVVTKYCLTSNGYLIVLDGDANSVKVAYEGTYEFRVIATDEKGNKQMVRHEIVVTA